MDYVFQVMLLLQSVELLLLYFLVLMGERCLIWYTICYASTIYRGILVQNYQDSCGWSCRIAWFGLQTYTGSAALLILIDVSGLDSRNWWWRGYLGISVPGLITFVLFWFMNLAIGLGGGEALNKFMILTPLFM